jgi:hypothetical protein
MGGTDDPSNLIDVTIEEHAEAHRILYEKLGNEEDKIAWLALSGQITLKEASILAWKLGSDKGRITQKKLWSDRGEWYKINALRISLALKKYFNENTHTWLGRTHKEQTKKIIGEKNSISQLGEKNSQFGTMWITNGSNNKKIKRIDIIPNGWYKGRVTK